MNDFMKAVCVVMIILATYGVVFDDVNKTLIIMTIFTISVIGFNFLSLKRYGQGLGE